MKGIKNKCMIKPNKIHNEMFSMDTYLYAVDLSKMNKKELVYCRRNFYGKNYKRIKKTIYKKTNIYFIDKNDINDLNDNYKIIHLKNKSTNEVDVSQTPLKRIANNSTKKESVLRYCEITIMSDSFLEMNGNTLTRKIYLMKDNSNRIYKVKLYVDRFAAKLYIKNGEIDIKNFSNSYSFMTREGEEIKEKTSSPNEIIYINPHDFLTRTSTYYCDTNHKTKDVTVEVNLISKKGNIISERCFGLYCEDCKRCYIFERDYQKLKSKGVLLCSVVEKSFWANPRSNNGFCSLSEESLLHVLGYNVSAKDDLTRNQRWKILESIVDYRIMTKSQIVTHLNYLINLNSDKYNFSNAIVKWKEDREHILQYKLNGPILRPSNYLRKKSI